MITTKLARTQRAQTIEVLSGPVWSKEIEEGVLDLESCVSSYTRTLYKQQWQAFEEWCAVCGYQSLPANSKTIREYFFWMHTYKPIRGGKVGVKARSLSPPKAAIRWKHRTSTFLGDDGEYHPYPDPTEELNIFVQALRKKEVQVGKSVQKQAIPLTEDDVQAIIMTADQRRIYPSGGIESPEKAAKRAKMDKALSTFMFSGVLRINEACNAKWEHVSEQSDGSGILFIPFSKTDRFGEGEAAYICPVAMRFLNDLRPENARPSDDVFPHSRRSLTEKINAASIHAGRGPRSGHSPRVGAAQYLAARGENMPSLKQAGRWKSGRTVSRYIEKMKVSQGAMAKHAPAFHIPDK